jgi:hypothetical protein
MAEKRPPPKITVFRERTGILNIFLILGGMMMLQGILTAIFFLIYGADEAWLTVVAVGMSLFLVWVGYFFAAKAWRRLRDHENPITIGPSGLLDRSISERPIPWSDITNLHIFVSGRGGPCVVFDLVEGAAEKTGVHPNVRRSAVVNRAFLYSYQIQHFGTDANVDKLVEAIAPFAEVRPQR